MSKNVLVSLERETAKAIGVFEKAAAQLDQVAAKQAQHHEDLLSQAARAQAEAERLNAAAMELEERANDALRRSHVTGQKAQSIRSVVGA